MNFFSKLPKVCMIKILSLTSPQDACRLSILGSTFRSAADSDAVWESFLPSDYNDVIARTPEFPSLNFSKKDLFFYLADTPLIIDNGIKSFSLDKHSGKKCYMLAARDLYIAWGNNTAYWMFTSLPKSRFPEVAELLDVCWLEIYGKISLNVLSPNTLYGAYFVFRITPQAYGIDAQPMEVSCGISGGSGECDTQTVFLDHKRRRKSRSRNRMRDLPKLRRDGWLEIKIGEYFKKNDSEDNGDLEMSFKEVKQKHWKSGIIVEGIEIRPVREQSKK